MRASVRAVESALCDVLLQDMSAVRRVVVDGNTAAVHVLVPFWSNEGNPADEEVDHHVSKV